MPHPLYDNSDCFQIPVISMFKPKPQKTILNLCCTLISFKEPIKLNLYEIHNYPNVS